MQRKEICPSCGKQLQCLYDDGYTKWYCQRCKYTRYDGAQENLWKFLKQNKRRLNREK